MKIYTKSGDAGETGLVDGSRVAKDAPRVAAYGDVDELNSILGLVRAQHDAGVRAGQAGDAGLVELLHQVQRDLFALGAQLADPQARLAGRTSKVTLSDEHVRRLEAAIDVREAELPPLRAFVLPGGSPLGALLHLARTVCRRAERTLVALEHQAEVDPLLLAYLNRLSDLLFVLARHVNHASDQPEHTW